MVRSRTFYAVLSGLRIHTVSDVAIGKQSKRMPAKKKFTIAKKVSVTRMHALVCSRMPTSENCRSESTTVK